MSAEWAAGQHARARDSVAVATFPSPVRAQPVHSRSDRLGDEAFMDSSVSFMASAGRHEFSTEMRTAVVRKASALLTSVRRSSFQSPELLSVRQAWSDMDNSSWQGQQEAGPTLALVTALRRAHDATETPVLWPTPQEALEELRRTKSGVTIAAVRGTTAAGMAAPGVTAAMVVAVVTVGVATPTTAARKRWRQRRHAWWR